MQIFPLVRVQSNLSNHPEEGEMGKEISTWRDLIMLTMFLALYMPHAIQSSQQHFKGGVIIPASHMRTLRFRDSR